ncbi:MAG: DUF4358 domain-containing protein [Oscillospiraceae bacterium]
MMKTKLTAITLGLLLSLSLTACSSAPDSSESSSMPESTPKASASPLPSTPPESSGEVSLAAANLSDYGKAMKEAYGADYIPDRVFTETEIQEKLGLSPEIYEEIYAEGSTLAENPDIFVAVKAKSGSKADVEEKLREYKDRLAADTAYAGRADKIKAAQVYAQGDNVFLLLLGANEFPDGGDDMAKNFSNEMKKGMDALKKMFA